MPPAGLSAIMYTQSNIREVTKEQWSGAALLLKSRFAIDVVFKTTNTL